ncbi:MAG: imidazolonepropionase [Eubacteriales bacterium]
MKRTLIKNIGLLQTPIGNFSHKGKAQGENLKLHNAAILILGDTIESVFKDGDLPTGDFDEIIDAEGKFVTPGLVDGHTHLVFGGYRHKEIPMKLAGADYLEIHNAGGGIYDTVRNTRTAGFDELYEKSRTFLDEMMSLGVTSVEAKSGYGLDIKNEIKQLQVVKKLSENHKMNLVSTFMGAHTEPEEYKGRKDEYVDFLCDDLMPLVKEEKLADFVDIFCEDSVFDAKQSEKYLLKAKELGFGLKIHAEEIADIGGSKIAGKLGAISAEHLIAIGEDGMNALKEGNVTAMLLPATSFYLGKTFAPARKMIDMGIAVATASDFNPGSCPSLNLQFVINLAYLKYRMTPQEILTAVTINPAAAIGIQEKVGSIEAGKRADLVIWNLDSMEMLCYRMGSNLVSKVISGGKAV